MTMIKTLPQIITTAINPALALLPPRMTSDEARTIILTIGLHESLYEHRRQMNNGPARSFWQFERGGGVKGVLSHPATKVHAQALCAARGVPFTELAVWTAMEFDDVLAAGMARLNLWWAPGALPKTNETQKAYDLYLFTWRPGKVHPEFWPNRHQRAREALGVA